MRHLIASAIRRVGIVDIGSNTIRMVVYERQPAGGFRLQDDLRERVRLGAGLHRTGTIEKTRIERALALLARFADYARGAGLDDLEAIGTSALRDAENGHELVAGARRLGLEVDVLAGEDEARLAVLAVANGFDLDNAWVIDLGGGSAQLARMEERRLAGGQAHPLGAVRLTEAYLASDPPRPREVRALEAEIADQLDATAGRLREDRGPLVAIGGTVRNLARAVQRSKRYPLDLLHGYWLAKDDLETLTERLLARPAKKRAAIVGISPDRADIVVAGALVFRWLLRHGDRSGLLISGDGVREGAFYRHVLRHPHLVADVAAASVESLMAQHGVDHDHARRVRGLARILFDELAPLHGLGTRDALLLDAAAALHDVGLAIHFYRRHLHAATLLRAAALDGFTHREQALLILMVRYQHKGAPRLEPFRPLMAEDDLPRLRRLVALLRLAIALDRSRCGRVGRVRARIKKTVAIVEVPVTGEESVELWSAQGHVAYASRALGRRLELRPTPVDAAGVDPRGRARYGLD